MEIIPGKKCADLSLWFIFVSSTLQKVLTGLRFGKSGMPGANERRAFFCPETALVKAPTLFCSFSSVLLKTGFFFLKKIFSEPKSVAYSKKQV